MKRIPSAKVLFIAVLPALLLLPASFVAAAGDPSIGKAIYERHCMACHGPQGKGDGPAGKMLKPPAADFTSAGSKKKSEADFKAAVENGKAGTAMGAWKNQLSQPEMRDVLRYVSTLRK